MMHDSQQFSQLTYKYANFYDFLQQHAANNPHKIAIYDHEDKISYINLKEQVNNLANYLAAHNIKKGDKVALVMTNSWQFVVNLFAITKLAAIAVPINNFLKEDELAYIINDAQAKLLFASHKFFNETKQLLAKTNIEKIVWVNGITTENEKNIDYAKIMAHKWHLPTETSSDSQELSDIHDINDLALIVYTSGTTGKPKGAMLSYKNILSNCTYSQAMMNLKDTKLTMIAYLPMFHAFTLTATVLLPLFTNSAIVVVRSISSKKDFKYLLKQLLLKRCRYFTGVPEIYSALARAKLPWYFHWFHNVTGFISGAAPLSEDVQARFTRAFKRGELLQGYGISECSPIVSCNTPKDNRVGSVGKPLLTYQIKIVDDNFKEVATKEHGEICVKGDCVMQGYYNKPQDTKEAIVDGWFKTGDIGYVDEDGYIFIVDRKKDVIIHKGMNIYPREIEELLYTHPQVNACAVIGLIDQEQTEVPIAYIELRENEEANEQQMKEFLKPFLAAFKLPRKIIFINKLPRNATGKILKRELRHYNDNEPTR